jgi:hypothetical protein
MGAGQQGFANNYQKPLGYQQITSLASAANLTPPTGTTAALITVETASVRWRDDGAAPTASIGMLLSAGQSFTYYGNLAAIQFIAQSGSPVVNVSYYA